MKNGKVNVLIDGQWGSTGKGKLAGLLADKHEIGLSVCNFMTNAGHTWVPDDGAPVMVQQLPSCLVSPETALHIAATAVIDPSVFVSEIEKFEPTYNFRHRLSVDPHAAIINKDHKELEARTMHGISSTAKGCGAALAEKVMRKASLVKSHALLGDGGLSWLGARVLRTEDVVGDALREGKSVLFETAQGFDLSINHGTVYPYTTSRDITVAQALNDACVAPQMVGDVYASLRAFPIRVGNAFEITQRAGGERDGWSGPCYDDHRELSWGEVTAIAGSKDGLLERTTVTNKVRRIFTFSFQQLDRFIRANRPTFLFINFVNYIDALAYGVQAGPDAESLNDFFNAFPKIREFVQDVESHGIPIAYLGTGPKHSHVVDLGVDR